MQPQTDISVSFTTTIGIITLHAEEKGLTGITLPPPGHETISGNESQSGYPVLNEAERQIKEYLAGKRHSFDLPLIIRGTEFQKKVWNLIKDIPYGQTLSYGEIAEKLGSTAKARAVGGAAHANPLPLVIPCHRVIGADGSLTGFGGGLALKKKLLELEQNHPGN